MTPENFLSKYEELAQGPNGISNLRKLVLSLAVRGKLVSQDPNDEPASSLIEEIKAEKERLISQGELRRERALPSLEENDSPYTIPETWTLARLGNLANIFSGNSINKSDKEQIYSVVEDGHNYVATKDLDFPTKSISYDTGVKTPYGDDKFRIAQPNAVLICSEGGSAGKKIAISSEPISFGNKLYASEFFTSMSPKFAFYVFQSSEFFNKFSDSKTGIIGGISLAKFKQLPFPLPPHAEQNRIVAKIDELMALCDELEQQQSQHVTLKHEAARASLHQLVTADTDASRQHHWSILTNKWDDWFDDLETIKQLRATILDITIRGRLVKQIENEKPSATDLLNEIRACAEHTKSNKKSQQLELPELFELPQAWEWASLSELSVFGPRNGYSPKPVDHLTSTKSMTLSAITSGVFDGNKSKYIDEEIPEDSYLWVIPGDILIQRANSMDFVGVSAIYNGAESEFIYPDLIMRVTITPKMDNRYVQVALSSPFVRSYFRQNASGTSGSMPKINQHVVKSAPVPVPPFAEQKRIMAKFDELIALCDQLEKQVREGDRLNEALMLSMVHHLVDGPVPPPSDSTPRSVSVNQAVVEARAEPAPASPDIVRSKPRAEVTRPTFIKAPHQTTAKTNEKFKEAVLVGAVVQAFFDDGGEPLGNFRIQKSVYFARRHMGETALNEEFLRKAAGPYNPTMKYSGGIKIAKDRGYIREARGRFGFGHITGPGAAELMTYADKYGNFKEAAAWARDTFKFMKNEEWELLATVDYALMHLEAEGIAATPAQILQYIAADDEWRPKVKKLNLSETKVEKAMADVRKLFAQVSET